MMTISITSALLIYFSSILFFLLTLWLTNHLKNRRKKIIPPLHALVTCEYCQYAYLATTIYPISRCPQCQSYNDNAIKTLNNDVF